MDRKKVFLIALSLILIAGFLLRFFPLRGGYHYWDETVYLQHGEIIAGESPDNYNEFDFRPPLFSLILGAIFTINSSLLAAHLTVAVLSSLTIILIYIIGKELYTRKTGLLAALIYALSPLAIFLAHDILVDPILPFFWLSTALLLVKSLETDERKYYYFTGLMAALSVLMKFTSLVIVPAIASTVVIYHFKQKELDLNELIEETKDFALMKTNWLMAAGFFTGILPYLVWSYIEFGSALHVFTTALTKSGARDLFMTYLGGWKSYILVPFYVGLPVFFWKADFQKLKNYLPIVFFLALFVPLQFFLPNKETRFLMPALPFLVLMASEGLRKLRDGEVFNNWKLSRALFVFLILVSVILVPTEISERNVFVQGSSIDWEAPVMDTGLWLRNNTDQDSIVYTNYQYPALGYYSKRDIIWIREYKPLNELVGQDIEKAGYLYFSKKSSYPHPTLDELNNDPRFRLNKTFDNTTYIFYFKGIKR